MKYLKEYSDVSKYEELSDYLQELFDKFGIIEKISFQPVIGPYWRILKSPEGARYAKQSQIIIVCPSSSLLSSISNNLLIIKPNLENRIGQKIEIICRSLSILIFLV